MNNIEEKLKNLKTVKPDQVWVNTLRNRIELKIANDTANSRKAVHSNLIIKLLDMLQEKEKMGLKLLGTFLFTTLMLTATYVSINKFRNPTLSQDKQQEILLSIIKSNPENVATKAAISFVAEAGDQALTTSLKRRAYNEFAYNYSKYENSKGPALGLCKYFDLGETAFLTSENFNYYANDDKAHYKSIVYNVDGSINSYFLTNSDASSSTSYEYMGGSFAIKTTSVFDHSDTPIPTDLLPMPAPEEEVEFENPEEAIKNYFGENAKVKEVVKRDGKDFYLVEAVNDIDCSQDQYRTLELRAPDAENANVELTKIVVTQLVDSETLDVVEVKNYFGDVSESNLISQSTITVENSNIDFDKVENKFQFDLNVPTKEIKYDSTNGLEKEKVSLFEYLKNSNLSILFAGGMELNSMYSSVQTTDNQPNYYVERGFYPAGVAGDKLFADINEAASYESWYNQSLLDTYFAKSEGDSYASLDVHIHKSNLPANDLVKNYVFEQKVKVKDINLTVDGNLVKAKEFVAEQEVMPMEDTIDPGLVPCEQDCTITTTLYYFELNGYQYIVSVNNVQIDKLELSTKSMKSAESSIVKDINSMYERMKNSVVDIAI